MVCIESLLIILKFFEKFTLVSELKKKLFAEILIKW